MSQLKRGQASRIMYIEHKSGQGDRGQAWIGRVTFSQTGKSIYYKGMRFQRSKGRGIGGNYFEGESGDYYWISGVKKDGSDRHWAGGGPVEVDADVAEEYAALRNPTPPK